MQQFVLGEPSTIYFLAETGLDDFPDFVLIGPEGVINSVTPSFTEVSVGLYKATFLVESTGYYTLRLSNNLHVFEVVRKTAQEYLGEVFDSTLGSWQWNKITGELTLLRTTGEVLGTYKVTDTSDSASREKLT